MPRGVRKNLKPDDPEAKNRVYREKVRQNLPIDWDQVGEWLELGATGVQIAEAIGMHEDTLYRRCKEEFSMTFAEYRMQKKSQGDFKLLKTQHNLAYKENAPMLIWLGKNRLGQRDTPQEIEVARETMNSFKEIADQIKSYQEKAKIEEK